MYIYIYIYSQGESIYTHTHTHTFFSRVFLLQAGNSYFPHLLLFIFAFVFLQIHVVGRFSAASPLSFLFLLCLFFLFFLQIISLDILGSIAPAAIFGYFYF
jgi:hypothetical protein